MGVDKFSWVTACCDFVYLADSSCESVTAFAVYLKYVQIQLSSR